MAEIFRRRLPETALTWTGERLVTGIEGQIETEHLHRYFLARDLGRGKDVLDVASGEGYGAALLAQTAASVVGVELDPDSVAHAHAAYGSGNLRYLTGDATRLPLDDACVDLVVSFETLEHFDAHDAFLSEIRRVLRPAGVLVISTPDSAVYSGAESTPNPYHVRELSGVEFAAALAARFRHVRMYRQRVGGGSAIVPDAEAAVANRFLVYERRDPVTFEAHRDLPRAPYLVALASDAELPDVSGSLLIAAPDASGEAGALQAEVQRLLEVEAAAREAAVAYATLLAERDALQHTLRQAGADAAAERDRYEGAVTAARQELAAVRQELTAARQELAVALQLAEQRAAAQNDACEAARAASQQHLAASEARGLAIRRLQMDLVQQGRALTAALAEADGWRTQAALHTEAAVLARAQRDAAQADALQYAQAYDRVSKLLVPVWMRRLAPRGLRTVLGNWLPERL